MLSIVPRLQKNKQSPSSESSDDDGEGVDDDDFILRMITLWIMYIEAMTVTKHFRWESRSYNIYIKCFCVLPTLSRKSSGRQHRQCLS